MLKQNKIIVAKFKPFNSSYIYVLYANFDQHGKFLFWSYSDCITCYIDDLLEVGSIFDKDLQQLYKLEKLF